MQTSRWGVYMPSRPCFGTRLLLQTLHHYCHFWSEHDCILSLGANCTGEPKLIIASRGEIPLFSSLPFSPLLPLSIPPCLPRSFTPFPSPFSSLSGSRGSGSEEDSSQVRTGKTLEHSTEGDSDSEGICSYEQVHTNDDWVIVL